MAETELYEAALTVMMRLVFLFCAEERGLMLLGDTSMPTTMPSPRSRPSCGRLPTSTARRSWSGGTMPGADLLSTFRAVYGGVEHERLKMPAYGGSLFDPDRFPFLEGRKQGTTWRELPADPLPVNNRTVLHLLEALQTCKSRCRAAGMPNHGG